MENTNQKFKFVDFQEKFSPELDSWVEIEHQQGSNGLKDFVIAGDVNLSEFLSFVEQEMGIQTQILVNETQTVCGFVCYAETEKDHIHIECLGVNPSMRKMGLAKNLLIGLKNKLTNENPDVKITLTVKKTNIAGIRSFSKVASEYEELSSENYIGLKL